MLLLDNVSPLERIRLSGQLSAQVQALQAAESVLARIGAARQVAELLRKLGTSAELKTKIRNFGWDAVKLSDLSFDELRQLREQVEAEHANPRDAEGRYLENGKPTLYLYDKKGRWKLDKLGWATTYKLQDKAKGDAAPSDSGRAPAGGVVGLNGEFYKGGTFLPNTTLPKQGKAAGSARVATGVLIEPGLRADAPEAGVKSIFNSYREFIAVDAQGVASVIGRPDAAIAAYVDEDVAEGRAFLRAAVSAYNAGMRWFKPGEIEVADEHREPPAAEQPQIIEHTTGRGKVIRGIVRTDLSYAEAKAIDEYTFRKDGGYFIREKHLEGYVPSDAPPAKAERTPEEIAQAEADRLADEQLRAEKRRNEQVAKLRAVAESTIARAEEELGLDRLANTARRARMAASATAGHEKARATGKTLLNLADAIESGQATHLSGISSRADVETLQDILVSAMYESDKGLSYAEQQARKGRQPDEADVRNAKLPMATWGTAGTSIAKVLEAIAGKKGSVALAKEIRYSPGPDGAMIRALEAMIGKKETSYQIGWWNLEQVARMERLRRAGITTTDQLRAALTEFLQFREGARKEDPIKAAERAIIGQKVGIDFFPTPAGVAVRMAQLARIRPGDRVLEPSAGNGNLADAARAAGAEVDVVEISSELRKILEAKGYAVVAHDFDSFVPEEKYDAIVMNPPFSARRDAEHIMRAFGLLKPGGRLVAIAGEGVFSGSDAKAVQFRDWLEIHGADVEPLQQGTFMDRNLLAQTGANARLIVLQK